MFEGSLPRKYDEFKRTVADIRSGAVEARYLGEGAESQVFEAIQDEQRYVVKFANRFTVLGRPRNTVRATQRKIDAGLRGLGIAGLEQIQTASLEDAVAVYGLALGKTADSLSEEDISKVTEKQLQALYDAIDQAVAAGIKFDPWNQDGSNALYDPDEGFTLIDYFVEYAGISPEESRLNGFKALGSTAIKLVEIFGER